MIILRMTASFGRLENEMLEFSPGLNVLSRPNEAGKSTWAAFLIAMLYGVDTTERARQGALPAKTKYKPWSGKPMQGILEVQTDDGRRIRIERSSRGRTPLGEFAAFDIDTGLPMESLTAENCGLTLLGIERSVFVRSAFIHQSGLAVTQDDALERRLSSLVTTGDERASASVAAKLLREQKNKIQHNKTGLLPQALREKEQIETTLAQIHAMHREDLSLAARQDTLTARLKELQTAEQALSAREQERKRQQLTAAREQAAQAERAYVSAREKTVKYPARERLSSLLRNLQALANETETPLRGEPQPPVCPPVFQGVAADALLTKAQRDGREFDRLTAGKRPSPMPTIVLLITAIIAAIAFGIRRNYIFCAVGILAALAGGAWALLTRRRIREYEQNMDAAQSILLQYENHSRDEFAVFAAQYREQLLIYEQQKAAYDAALSAQQAHALARAGQQAAILGAVSVFAPDANDAPSALRALERAKTDYDALDRAEQALRVAQSRASALESAFGEMNRSPMPPGNWDDLDAQQIAREKAQLTHELQSVRSRLDESRGRVAAMGDAAAIRARLEELETQIATLQRRYAAIDLAEQTLMAADSELQTRFAPRIASRAGEYFAALTGNRYDRVLLDRELRLSAGQTGEAGVHQLLNLSSGTADQLYLAARLAICDLVLPAHTPLILDDALLSFDDTRLQAALELLARQGKTRQILLFSCHSREQVWLYDHAGSERG